MDFQVEGAVPVVVVGREAVVDLAAVAVFAVAAVLVVAAGLLTTGGFGFCVCVWVCASAIPGAIASIATASHKRGMFPIGREDLIAAPTLPGCFAGVT